MINTNVFRTRPVIEPEKLSVHGSLVGLAVEPVTSYIYIYIYINKNNKLYLNFNNIY